MFNLETFIADCRSAVQTDPSHRGPLALMRQAFTDPAAVMAALGEPTQSGLTPLYQAADLTIVNVVWKPGISIRPHNHETWAVIGIYTGREDNLYWRRRKDDPTRIEAAGAQALSVGDVTPLGKDIIHSVINPIDRLTGAIHVYGGDFFKIDRSEWDPETLIERPYDMAQTRALFGN
jgi:predicted metal-dependent enzyme (double-stranded beta helix superfamily)